MSKHRGGGGRQGMRENEEMAKSPEVRVTLATAADDIAAVMATLDGIDDPAQREAAEREMAPMIQRAVRKVDSFGAYLRGLSVDIKNQAEEIKRLQARKKAFEKRVERLESYAMMALDATGVDRLEGSLSTLAKVSNPGRVVIDSPSAIPDAYRRVTADMAASTWAEMCGLYRGLFGGDPACWVEYSTPLKPIADAINRGEDVPGARIDKGTRLEVR